MVVSASETCQSAGLAGCTVFAGAGAATSASERPSAADARRRNILSIKILPVGGPFAWANRAGKLTRHLPLKPCRAAEHQPKPRLERGHIDGANTLEPELPGPDPHASSLLGRAGLRHPPAL